MRTLSDVIEIEVVRNIQKTRLAMDAVRSVVGDVGDCKSPGAVFKRALRKMGYDTADLTGAAAAAMWPVLRHQPRRASGMAMDSKQQQAFADDLKRFPGATALKRR